MTYTIEHYQFQLVDDELVETWTPLESFEDKALAEKELRNLDRAWVASGTFRLVYTPD